MNLTTLLATLVPAASILAAPQFTPACPGCPISVSVTNYLTGCSPGGCTYSFSVSGPSQAGFGSAFDTTCNGTDVQGFYKVCGVPDLAANLVPVQRGDQVLHIQRTPKIGSETILWYGNVTTGRVPKGEPQSFEVDLTAYGAIAGA
ncbi:hypothetical protein BJ875DRAFT_467750 [Amylocarpus encephaloides]|uniref:Uncharacterized protein n=1 Tax=Amylocarpus encephaloides TaxID=45428 RepID=A0A9P8C320_9HELO|nr:hypothetical protein BJ875DRAFT_467750 [Amylocarpus encephaloides]